MKSIRAINASLKYVEKKWTLHILACMLSGMTRFTEFEDANEQLSAKVLSSVLKDMVEKKLITKEVVSLYPIKIEYHLTPLGRRFRQIINAFVDFSSEQIL